ncbi:MAG TPA: thiamine pyrophosphate-binding protein [Longimicrobiales bacterium]|nr:thiamine pyrophosphate-binding protein [Longimicrobiales bacterium]
MTPTSISTLEAVLAALEGAGVTHVLGIPDNTSGPLFDALGSHPSIRLVAVTREGEAFAVASGLWLGGASPLVVVQNTGFLESGDAIRGTATRMGAPVPMVVTGRGYAKMEAAGLGPHTPRTPALLTRAELDSVAFVTEPTLDAWGIPYRVCRPGDDVAGAIAELVTETTAGDHPRALLLTAGLS